MKLREGTLLKRGDYKIEKVLGQGGFGITYLAEQTGLGHKVALKEFFMQEHCNRDADGTHVSVGSVGSKKLVERFRQKFLKEARLIASFDNSNIIKIHDVFEENGTAYYVMEYLEGKSITVKEYAFADSNEISTVTNMAASECDALYVPTDNQAATAAETIYGAMANNLKPLIAGEEATCKGCGIATLTISYYDLGYATGKMAVKILKGEEKIENMPVEYAATFTKKYNKTICDELGIDTAALEAAGYVAIQ